MFWTKDVVSARLIFIVHLSILPGVTYLRTKYKSPCTSTLTSIPVALIRRHPIMSHNYLNDLLHFLNVYSAGPTAVIPIGPRQSLDKRTCVQMSQFKSQEQSVCKKYRSNFY